MRPLKKSFEFDIKFRHFKAEPGEIDKRSSLQAFRLWEREHYAWRDHGRIYSSPTRRNVKAQVLKLLQTVY